MKRYSNILALDTALSGCSTVAVIGERVASRVGAMSRGQAEHLVPFVEEVLEELNADYDQLEAIVCVVGPGAFTGLRIGLSTARGFALSLGLPIIGVSSLQALALDYVAKVSPNCGFTVVLETKRQDFYAQSFDAQGMPVDEARAVHGDVLAD